MALLDRDRDRFVLRIVYDGPALAGKTTSVKALAGLFDRRVFSAEGADGRTSHFDWMEYQGGRFEGLAICCQVVTVPGQEVFAPRRFALLDTADAVVFTVDSRPAELEAGLRSFASLRRHLAARPEPRPGVLLQANKRDLPDAVPVETIRRRLDLGSAVAVIETVAADGDGVRQGFVFAVRLALDRIAELARRGELPRGRPAVEDGEALLASLASFERAPLPDRERRGAAATPLTEAAVVRDGAGATPAPEAAELPGPDLPSGRVWRPIEGRVVLHEVAARGVRLARLPSGEHRGTAGPWQIHSSSAAAFEDGERGRTALMAWARWHAALGRYLSMRRCLALGGASGTYRLWQVVHAEPTLGRRVARALQAGEPEAAARTLLQAAEALREIHAAVGASGLRIALETVGILDTGPAYVGWAPTPSETALGPVAGQPEPIDLRAAFAPAIERAPPTLGPLLSLVAARVEELARHLGQEETGRMLVDLLTSRRWRQEAAS